MNKPTPSSGLAGLPHGVGIGLKREHCQALLADPSPVDFVEIHAENFMSAGGPNLVLLDRIAATWPLSIHGVALSLGGEAPLDQDHLLRLRRLLDRAQPTVFSEHLAWSSHDGVYFNDLLPIGLAPVWFRPPVYHYATLASKAKGWTCTGLVPATCLSLCHLSFESQGAYAAQI